MARATSPRRSGLGRRARLTALAGAAVLMTSACGIYPGQAAVVGGTEISPDEVDTTAAVVCVVDQSVGGQQSIARRKAVEFLVGTELIEMFGRDQNALPTGGQVSANPALEQIQQDAATLPADIRQDYVDTITRLVESQQTLVNVGFLAAAEDGTGVDGALAAGSSAYSEWLVDQAPEVTVDPRFGQWEGSALVPGDSSLSVAVSEESQQQGGEDLPATQTCS